MITSGIDQDALVTLFSEATARDVMQSHAALVSGVLIGMSEGLQPAANAPKAAKSRKKA
jgi:hypothetical protein